jgi:hypothetical protein
LSRRAPDGWGPTVLVGLLLLYAVAYLTIYGVLVPR